MAVMANAITSVPDIDKQGKYPIVLSDALLGKSPNSIYTSIRYNHKPEATSSTSTSDLHLQPSEADPTSYDLSFTENEEQNRDYNGSRNAGESQYVLIFDPEKKHFVLHRLDSTFDMNLTGAPWTEDASILRNQYTQLEPKHNSQPPAPVRKPSKTTKATTNTTKPANKQASTEKTKKPKPPPRDPTPDPEDDDNSDDGLQIEYPGGAPPVHQHKFTSTPIFQREPSEEISDEDIDAEHEVYQEEPNRDVNLLKLPSPANNNAEGLSDEDIEADLEAELEQALQEEGIAESDESEEE